MQVFRIVLFMVCSCTLFSCVNNVLRREDVYVIPKKVKAEPYVTSKYYRTYNIIIDSGARTYFYQQWPSTRPCGNVNWWEEVAIPSFIDLNPKDLVEIPANGLEDFIKVNVLGTHWVKERISISSNIDTVSCNSMSTLMKIFKDTAKHVDYLLRKTTQEEDFVLERKKWPDSYNSLYGFKWDSTKTLFMEVIDKIETDNINAMLDFEEAHLKKRTADEVKKLNEQICDSALYQKLADRLGLKMNVLFDFEL